MSSLMHWRWDPVYGWIPDPRLREDPDQPVVVCQSCGGLTNRVAADIDPPGEGWCQFCFRCRSPYWHWPEDPRDTPPDPRPDERTPAP